MSAESAGAAQRRLVTFEVGGVHYALPIADVLEVTESTRVACVPTLPLEVGGVVNVHGEALPVVFPSALLGHEPADLAAPEHMLVLAAGPDESAARMAVPVDRVIGLAGGGPAAAPEPGLVVERRPIEGRVVRVLDTGRMVARAAEIVERSVGHPDAGLGGE